MGRKQTEQTKKKLSDFAKHSGTGKWNAGRKRPEMIGEKNPSWKGGVTPLHQKIRNSPEYGLWRNSVFTRDDYTCVFCARRGVRLNADHIKPFSLFPELRFAIDNGRTLCFDCHKKTPTFGANKYRRP